MQKFARLRRRAAVIGRSVYSGLLLLVFLGESAAQTAVDDIRLAPVLGAGVALPRVYGAAGGGRLPASGLRLPGLPATQWSPAMSRHDVLLGRIDPDHDDDYLYRLPYADGASFPVIQSYGAKLSHLGVEQYTVDFGMPVGTPVHAAREGVVVLLEDSHDGNCWREECGRLANFVVVLHSDGTTGEYFHLERGSVTVRLGEQVLRGQPLALSGNTGYSTAPHLHFGVYRALADGHTQSVAVRFRTRVGAVALARTGRRYLNVSDR
jgi:murein DD-endopeptidase MepM/ murein hydrolase activator NlpD